MPDTLFDTIISRLMNNQSNMTTDDPLPDSAYCFRPTIAIQTVGCKLNQAESETLAHHCLNAGFDVVTPRQNPDILILNTCTVTHIADRKCRQYLRSFHRRNPDSLIVAAGCYVNRDPDGVEVEGVDILVENVQKDQLVTILKDRICSGSIQAHKKGNIALPQLSRNRSMVKIQEGCSQGCSYCIVPTVRGTEKSVPVETVLSEVKRREREGYKEVILTGTRIGKYWGGVWLEGVLKQILEITGIARIRLSSLQPGEISETLVDLWRREDRVCRHLHLALQSGCESTLRRMGRSYTIDEYLKTIHMVRQAMPDIAVTTDIIVGFPGETNQEFEESLRVCTDIGFAGIHVFPYSVRSGTPAANLPGKVPDRIKRNRIHKMIELAKQSTRDFHSRFYGQAVPVLWEECKEGHIWAGHTSNYIRVFTSCDDDITNRLIATTLICEYQDHVWGDIPSVSQLVETSIKGV